MSFKTQKKEDKKIKTKKGKKSKDPKEKGKGILSILYIVAAFTMLAMGLTMIFAWSHFGTKAYNKSMFIWGIVLAAVGFLASLPIIIGACSGFAEGIRSHKTETEKPK